MMSRNHALFEDSDDTSAVESPKTSKNAQKPNNPSPKSNFNNSTRKYSRGFLFETITEETETQINETRKSFNFRTRANIPSKSDEKSFKSRRIPTILLSSPPISPKLTRARRKLKPKENSDESRLETSDEFDNSPQISPIRPSTRAKYDYSGDSHLEESEELDISTEKCSSTPKTARKTNLRKKIATKHSKSKSRPANIDDSHSSSDSGDDFVPIKPKKRPKAVPKRKKKATRREVQFSPIRKCPDDFVEHNAENPKYYLKDNIKSYDDSKSTEKRFLESKRINELRNVEIPPKRSAKMAKNELKMKKWARKLNEEFSDIEKNYELFVETS